MEQWKPVDGTNGMIEVSTEGRCRSWLRSRDEARILKTQPDQKGYLRLRVTIDRRKLSFKVHRMVAKAFIPNPNSLPQVNHKNGNRADNRVENLEWCTNQMNVIHSFAMRAGEHVGIDEMKYMPKRNEYQW